MGFFGSMGRERRRIDSGSLLASVDGDADVFFDVTNPCDVYVYNIYMRAYIYTYIYTYTYICIYGYGYIYM